MRAMADDPEPPGTKPACDESGDAGPVDAVSAAANDAEGDRVGTPPKGVRPSDIQRPAAEAADAERDDGASRGPEPGGSDPAGRADGGRDDAGRDHTDRDAAGHDDAGPPGEQGRTRAPSGEMGGWSSAALLPVSAVRLAGRFFVPLALWFSAGSIVRYLLLQGVSRLGHGDHMGVRKAVVLLPLSLAVLASLVVSIGMLFTLGRGLAVIDDPDEPYVAAIGRTLFPFVLVYLGWNLYLGDLKELLRFDAQRLADAGDPMDAGTVLQLPVLVCLAVAAVAWALRVLCERRSGERPGHVIAALTAFFEVNFTLYGLYSITQILIAARHWLTGRVFWQALAGTVSLPSAGPVLSALGLPLVWLAIAAIVFGLEMRAHDAVEGTVLARLAARLDGRPRRLAEVAGRSLREKYLPPAHAVRLVFRAGAPVFAWFCLCYAALGALLDRVQRGVVALIGPDHTVRFWNLALTPIEFGHRMLYEIVRLALLAAMFDLVTRRAGVLSAGRSAPARPAPATGPRASSA